MAATQSMRIETCWNGASVRMGIGRVGGWMGVLILGLEIGWWMGGPARWTCAAEGNQATQSEAIPRSDGPDRAGRSTSGAETKQEVLVWPVPLPSIEARQKARKLLDEVYKDQIVKARLPHEKTKLAKELLDLALEDTDLANQYVLAEEARRLAIEAMDRKLAMRAVELLAQFTPVGGKVSAAEATKLGHAAWAIAEKLTGKVQLVRQTEAARWYLHVLPGDLADLEESVIRKRLAELGYQQTFQLAYEFNAVEGWIARKDIASLKIQDGILHGKVTGKDPGLYCLNLNLEARKVRFVEIRLAVSHDSVAQLYWITSESSHFKEDKAIWFPVQGCGRFYVYRLVVQAKPTWKGRILGIRFDPVNWHSYQDFPQDPVSFQIDFIRFVE